MTILSKNPQAEELNARADAIKKELMDPEKEFTADEVQQKTDAMKGLLARAALAAEFTSQKEIERQTPEGQHVPSPENPDGNEDNTRSYADAIKKLHTRVRRDFGGINSYILALAKRSHEPLTTAQMETHKKIEELHQRAIVGTASDASGGEFLLPLEQVASIFQVDNVVSGLAQIAQRFPVSGRTLRIPYAKQTAVANTRPGAGIANVSIVGEGSEKDELTPAFGQRLLTVYKYAAYTEIADEMLADDLTGDLAPTVQRLVGGQVMNAINEHITIDGTGTAMPMGGFNTNNPSLLVVNRTTSQDITTDDIFAMYAKHTFGGGQSIWLANRTTMPKLFALTLTGNNLVTFLQTLNGPPQMTLLGQPVVMSDLMSQLGVQGDLGLVNGSFYALALRQALTVESSIHYKFRNDITAYRFLARAGGIPIPDGTYAYKSTGAAKIAEHSPFVVLGDDVTS